MSSRAQKRKPRTISYQSNSLGNKLLPEQIRKLKKNKSFHPEPPKSDDQIKAILDRHNRCCAAGDEKGCFLKIFKLSEGCYDYTKAFSFFREAEEPYRRMNSEERDICLKNTADSFGVLDSGRWDFKFSIRKDDEEHPVCMRAYAESHGFSKSTFERFISKYKNVKNNDEKVISSMYCIPAPFLEHDTHYTINEMKVIIADNVVGETFPSPQILRSALSPSISTAKNDFADRAAMCVAWLEKHFEATGDVSPNSDFLKVDDNFKNNLYQKYCRAIVRHGKPVSESRFYELWCTLFPYSVIRPWCNVPGKCATCYEIQKGRTSTKYKDNFTQGLYKQAHAIHRAGMFNIERAKYRERILDALVNPSTTMSMIIDGMDQSHCRCPYLGTNDTFTDALSQQITAIKEHGHGVKIFRTLETVGKGANFTIHCILAQIEDWKIRHNNQYPEKIYLQVDGGSENANQYLLAMLELLVIKRMAKTIYFTRLPTGHTHEDIDGVFAVIWRTLRKKPILTLEDYVYESTHAFKMIGLKVEVVTPMIIADFQMFLEPVLDAKLARLHKEIQTQHQWRFEAVELSTHFPLGCKVAYKAYSADIVYEIRNMDPILCITEIGRHTGLETYKVYNTWQPEATGINACQHREGVEGFWLLKAIPYSESPVPAPLQPKCYEMIEACMAKVRSTFSLHGNEVDREVRESWDSWYDIYKVPENENVLDYQRALNNRRAPMRVPLRVHLWDQDFFVTNHSWQEGSGRGVINPMFEYDAVLQAAMNSVVCEHNKVPLNPRFTAIRDSDLVTQIDNYAVKCDMYYSGHFTTDDLKVKIRRQVTYNGIQMSVSGSKSVLLHRIRSFHSSAFTTLFRVIHISKKILIDRTMDFVSTVSCPDKVEWVIKGDFETISIKKSEMASFREGCRLSSKCVRAFLALFQLREKRILSAHTDVNAQDKYYHALKKTLFLPPEFIESLLDESIDIRRYFPLGISISDYHQILMLSEHPEDSYTLIVFNFTTKHMYLLDPLLPVSHILTVNEIQLLTRVRDSFCENLDLNEDAFRDWSFAFYPHQFYEDLPSIAEEGVAIEILTIIYFLVIDAPIFYNSDLLNTVRVNFCYWLMHGELPL